MTQCHFIQNGASQWLGELSLFFLCVVLQFLNQFQLFLWCWVCIIRSMYLEARKIFRGKCNERKCKPSGSFSYAKTWELPYAPILTTAKVYTLAEAFWTCGEKVALCCAQSGVLQITKHGSYAGSWKKRSNTYHIDKKLESDFAGNLYEYELLCYLSFWQNSIYFCTVQ